ncbi:hypothetical protein [Paracoccus aerodenitrificans]|uniref:hypothetical protein n=1 Tax=Paracoccus aerodenitrificans TaxID=3017781 RepID=UPI003EBB9221
MRKFGIGDLRGNPRLGIQPLQFAIIAQTVKRKRFIAVSSCKNEVLFANGDSLQRDGITRYR